MTTPVLWAGFREPRGPISLGTELPTRNTDIKKRLQVKDENSICFRFQGTWICLWELSSPKNTDVKKCTEVKKIRTVGLYVSGNVAVLYLWELWLGTREVWPENASGRRKEKDARDSRITAPPLASLCLFPESSCSSTGPCPRPTL